MPITTSGPARTAGEALERSKQFSVHPTEHRVEVLSRVATTKDNEVTTWQFICCLLAVPVVYFFAQYFYEAVAITFRGVGLLIGHLFQTMTPVIESLTSGRCAGLGDCLARLVFYLVVVVPVVLLFAAVAFVLAAVVAVGVLIPYGIAYWLATHPGPPRYLLDVVLVWYVAMFLYGVLFPFLWRLTEPLIAHTLGEIAFQRARARVYGTRPRYAQPLYLGIGLMGLISGGAYLTAPIGTTAAATVATGWHRVSDPVFRPATPTPRIWPKVFTVPPRTRVETGIVLPTANSEVPLATSAHVFAAVGRNTAFLWKTRADLPQGCVAPHWREEADRCAFGLWGFATTGELVLSGGDEFATVNVYQPRQYDRLWLAPGVVHKVERWADRGSTFYHCGGRGLRYRSVRRARTTAWSDLRERTPCEVGPGAIGHSVPQGVEVPGDGFVEVTATTLTWFKFLTITPPASRWFDVRAGRTVDTKIPVRPGDQVRIAAGREAIYAGAELRLVAGKHYIEEFATAAGTVRVKGGILDSMVQVTVLARGPGWK